MNLHPGDFLSLVVEISVAIAGFSGIVIVLGRRQSVGWTSVDHLRLSGLLICILLLIINAISITAFWPFAIALAYHVAMALFNFVGLLTRAISAEGAT